MTYFTPHIEDIRVSYEYEYSLGTNDGPWNKVIIKSGLDIDDFINDKSNNIPQRVPYLTKEQIEAEGWRLAVGEDYHVTLFRMGKYTLGYNWEKETLKIVTFEANCNILYNGECKDINTLRYITKLLNIK